MTGLFFGSFNPIHIGHLIIANFMLEHANLDEVWFIVSPHNPLKDKSVLASEKYRLQMVKIAIKGNEFFEVSDIEFKLAKPSFTINTLDVLSKKFPKKKFRIIMGSDSLESIFKWKEWSKIIAQYMIFVYRRGPINDIQWKEYPGIIFFNAPVLHISSTLIRELLYNKKSIRYLVPDKVLECIKKNRLYTKKKS